MSLSLYSAPACEPLTVNDVRRQLLLGTSAGEPAPVAPTVALLSPAAPGNCDNGDWRIGFTFVTADGETELGQLSAVVTVADKTVNGKIAVSGIQTGGSSVTSRKCYALAPNASTAKYVATIGNNTDTTLTVNIAASGLGADAPTTNTTQDPELVAMITSARERCELATQRALLSQVWTLTLDRFPDTTFIELPKAPLIEVVHVKYLDTQGVQQTWASTNYTVEAPAGPRCRRGRLSLKFSGVWPIVLDQAGAIEIRFECGYGESRSNVPSLLLQAMKLDVATMYANREDVVKGTIVTSLPNAAKNIYWSHRSHATQVLD